MPQPSCTIIPPTSHFFPVGACHSSTSFPSHCKLIASAVHRTTALPLVRFTLLPCLRPTARAPLSQRSPAGAGNSPTVFLTACEQRTNIPPAAVNELSHWCISLSNHFSVPPLHAYYSRSRAPPIFHRTSHCFPACVCHSPTISPSYCMLTAAAVHHLTSRHCSPAVGACHSPTISSFYCTLTAGNIIPSLLSR